MALPDRLNISRGDWSQTTASSTDTGVQYARGNVVRHGNHTWMYNSDTPGNSMEPSTTNNSWIQIDVSTPAPPAAQPTIAPTTTSFTVDVGGTFSQNFTLTFPTGATNTQIEMVMDPGMGNTLTPGPINNLMSTIVWLAAGDATASAGTVHASFRASWTSSGGQALHHDYSFTLTVRMAPPAPLNWYTSLSTTQPTAVADMMSQGVYMNNASATVTANDTMRNLYVAAPMGMYIFGENIGILSSTELEATFDTQYSLYQINDFDDSQDGTTFIFSIMEA